MRFKRVIFLLFFIAAPIAATAGQVEPGVVIRQLSPKDGQLYSWLHHGTLFFRSYDEKRKGDYLYCGNSGYLKTVSNLEEFSAMIQEQFGDDSVTMVFIRCLLPRVIFAFMGPPHACVIDHDYLESRNALPGYTWESAPVGEVQESFHILKRYDYAGPVITKGAWTLEFYASLHNGSVEKWNLDGNIHPFSVDHLRRTFVEKKGTVIPIPQVGAP